MTRRSILVGALATLFATNAFATAVDTNWKNITYDQAQCLSRASAALTAAGMTTGLTTVAAAGTVTGGQGQYQSSVVCAADHHAVFIATAGPPGPDTGRITRQISAAL